MTLLPVYIKTDGTSIEVMIAETSIANALTSVDFHIDADERRGTVGLELILPTVEIDGVQRVEVMPAIRDALIALGWTPPADGQPEDSRAGA